MIARVLAWMVAIVAIAAGEALVCSAVLWVRASLARNRAARWRVRV